MARPPKYTEWLKPENLNKVTNWAVNISKKKDIAALIGISVATFCEWERRFPEFSEALKRGYLYRSENLENTLHDLALGYCEEKTEVIETEEVFSNGHWIPIKQKKKITRKHIPPNAAVAIFESKNRLGYSDNPRQESDDYAAAEFLKAWRDD